MSSYWRSWGNSVIGPLHQRQGLPNQDAWLARHYTWGDVVAVADGVGSKPHADIGAKMACRAVCEAAKTYRHNASAPLEDLTRLIHRRWLMLVAPYSASDCTATCLFVIRIHKELIVGQLGDGMIVLCADPADQGMLIMADKRESFSNMTRALTEKYDASQWFVTRKSATCCRAVVLCTDGISDDLLPGQHQAFAERLIGLYRKRSRRSIKKDLARWLNAWPVPHHADDKTIAGLCRQGALAP
jgi:serine/threonine protein phosphatase PrpC